MKILGGSFVQAFESRILNTHPSLLPAFPGAHAVADALAHGAKVTGCTVHLVDEGLDTGPIVAQEAVVIQDGVSVDEVHEQIKQVERRLVVDVVRQVAAGGLTVEGRICRLH
jgi:phosphoribosylglycinamide formyltransferase-1